MHDIENARLAQREGPRFLSRLCLVGVVASERAQKLLREGQRLVALLALVEPTARSYVVHGIARSQFLLGPDSGAKLLCLWSV